MPTVSRSVLLAFLLFGCADDPTATPADPARDSDGCPTNVNVAHVSVAEVPHPEDWPASADGHVLRIDHARVFDRRTGEIEVLAADGRDAVVGQPGAWATQRLPDQEGGWAVYPVDRPGAAFHVLGVHNARGPVLSDDGRMAWYDDDGLRVLDLTDGRATQRPGSSGCPPEPGLACGPWLRFTRDGGLHFEAAGRHLWLSAPGEAVAEVGPEAEFSLSSSTFVGSGGVAVHADSRGLTRWRGRQATPIAGPPAGVRIAPWNVADVVHPNGEWLVLTGNSNRGPALWLRIIRRDTLATVFEGEGIIESSQPSSTVIVAGWLNEERQLTVLGPDGSPTYTASVIRFESWGPRWFMVQRDHEAPMQFFEIVDGEVQARAEVTVAPGGSAVPPGWGSPCDASPDRGVAVCNDGSGTTVVDLNDGTILRRIAAPEPSRLGLPPAHVPLMLADGRIVLQTGGDWRIDRVLSPPYAEEDDLEQPLGERAGVMRALPGVCAGVMLASCAFNDDSDQMDCDAALLTLPSLN